MHILEPHDSLSESDSRPRVIDGISGKADMTELGFWLFLLMVLAVLAMFAYVYFTGYSLVDLETVYRMAPVIVGGGVFLAIGSYGSILRERKQRKLKIVKASADGITLGRNKTDIGLRMLILWSNVKSIVTGAGDKSSTAGPVNLLITVDSGNTYVLTWENAFTWVDSEHLFSLARTYAPSADIQVSLPEMQMNSSDSRYTNLWLQYFSTPVGRARKGSLSSGDILCDGKYEVVEKIGGGGQGLAYTAFNRDDSTGLAHAETSRSELVVLKEYVLPVHRGQRLEDRLNDLLSREAQILSRIEHPLIVRIVDCFVEDHRGYIVLEHVDGVSLKQLVSERGPMDSVQVLRITLDVCEILSYLHNLSPAIIHRDLTPDNLILRNDGIVKLVDFTVAYQFESQRSATVVGKQAYVPPEQFRGRPEPASDLYALGCTMFYLLTGNDPPPMQTSSPLEAGVQVDQKLDAVIRKCTAFDARERYSNAGELREALRS